MPCRASQNVPKRIIASANKQTAADQEIEARHEILQKLSRNAAAVVASKVVGGSSFRGGPLQNQDTGESYLKSYDIDGSSMLRDSVGGGGGGRKDGTSSASASSTSTTTEKYPMQWGYQVLPTLYSIYQKVPPAFSPLGSQKLIGVVLGQVILSVLCVCV